VRAGAGGASWNLENAGVSRSRSRSRSRTWRMLARAGAGAGEGEGADAGATSWCHELALWHGERELEPLSG